MKAFLITSIALYFLAFCLPSSAWNKGGHQTTGAIAYRELATANPALIARVQAIMKAHPTPTLTVDRANTEASDETKAERLFMEMAIWSDEVRPQSAYSKEFHRDTWHWINIVYTTEGNKFSKPDEVVKDRIFEEFAKNAASFRVPRRPTL